jgi:hypothetical protein
VPEKHLPPQSQTAAGAPAAHGTIADLSRFLRRSTRQEQLPGGLPPELLSTAGSTSKIFPEPSSTGLGRTIVPAAGHNEGE